MLFGRKSNEDAPIKKMTPEEVELASFKERERLDKVKSDLSKYRKQENIFQTPKKMDIFNNDGTIFNPEKKKRKVNVKSSKNILTKQNIFMR